MDVYVYKIFYKNIKINLKKNGKGDTTLCFCRIETLLAEETVQQSVYPWYLGACFQ